MRHSRMHPLRTPAPGDRPRRDAHPARALRRIPRRRRPAIHHAHVQPSPPQLQQLLRRGGQLPRRRGHPRHILDLPDEVMSTPLGQQLMPMLSMMDAQMRTVSEGVEDTRRVDAPDERRRRPRRNEQFSRPRRRRPRSNEQFRRPWRRRPRSNEQFRRPQKRARRRRSRLRSRRSCQVGGAGHVSQRRGGARPARRDRRRVSRSADEPTNASTSYVYPY